MSWEHCVRGERRFYSSVSAFYIMKLVVREKKFTIKNVRWYFYFPEQSTKSRIFKREHRSSWKMPLESGFKKKHIYLHKKFLILFSHRKLKDGYRFRAKFWFIIEQTKLYCIIAFRTFKLRTVSSIGWMLHWRTVNLCYNHYSPLHKRNN